MSQRDEMAPDPILQERIYEALKAEIRAGVIGPADHIELQLISDRHRASVTPVREALCRLVGEGLAEVDRPGGFRISALGGPKLRDLYVYSEATLANALALSSESSLDTALAGTVLPADSATSVSIAAAFAAFFANVAIASGNGEFHRAVSNANDRLSAARIAETIIFPDMRREFLMFTHGPRGQLRKTLSRRFAAYHRRRVMQSGAIAANSRVLRFLVP